jgi:hypothetical protein
MGDFMSKKKLKLIGIIISFIICFPFHFVYDKVPSFLTSIFFPNRLTKVEMYAFENCENLKSITIPDSVTSIGYAAFYGCSGLESITIPNSVTSIGDVAFYYCPSLTTVNFTGTEQEWLAIEGISNIDLPSNVTINYNYVAE